MEYNKMKKKKINNNFWKMIASFIFRTIYYLLEYRNLVSNGMKP